MIDKRKNIFSGAVHFTRPIFVGVVVSAVLTVLTILLISLIFAAVKTFSDSLVIPLAVLCAATGAFAGGFIAARLLKCRGLIIGLCVGAIFFLFVWIAGLIWGGAGLNLSCLIVLILLCSCGGSGGYCGVNIKKKSRRA